MIYLAVKFYDACLIHDLLYQPESYSEFLHIHHLIILHSMKKISITKITYFFNICYSTSFQNP